MIKCISHIIVLYLNKHFQSGSFSDQAINQIEKLNENIILSNLLMKILTINIKLFSVLWQNKNKNLLVVYHREVFFFDREWNSRSLESLCCSWPDSDILDFCHGIHGTVGIYLGNEFGSWFNGFEKFLAKYWAKILKKRRKM